VNQALIDCAKVLLPEGVGPFPVVIQMHACGGLHPMQNRYAHAAVEAGTAVVILDSFTPRQIGDGEALLTVCTGLRLRGSERAADLRSILDWLWRQPWADTDRIAAAGWSHGAWSIMEALAADDGHAGVAALKLAMLVYPYAGPLSQTTKRGWGRNRPVVLACLAGRDLVVGRLAPRRAISRLQSDGLSVELLEFADAGHCFDEDEAHPPGVAYRPDLEALLRQRYALALRRTLIEPYSPGVSSWAATGA
jgi:dienelactone hydrolase